MPRCNTHTRRLGRVAATVAAAFMLAPQGLAAGRADAMGRLLKLLPKADANRDGKLTPAELKAWIVKADPGADGNGDGNLSNLEMMAFVRKLRGRASGGGQTAGGAKVVGDSWKGIPAEALKNNAPSLRACSPVILTGAKLHGLKGIKPGRLVAFRFAGGWRQVPVQVDERAVVEYFEIYNRNQGAKRGVGTYLLRGPCFRGLVYTDPTTYTGPDADASLDADDEVVFLFKDAARRPAAFADPGGVVKSSGVEVELADPLTGEKRYVYLFASAGGLNGAGGKDYVEYAFKLKRGPYKKTWIIGGAAGLSLRPRTPAGYKNPEDSNVTTAFYTRHFSAKAVTDSLKIHPPWGTGVNLIDMRKALFAPGVAGRSVLTFTQGEGAFIANIDGPVRAIRSAVGANSGPLTQFDCFFYERREDAVSRLRVHPIQSVVTFTDYSPAAAGMTYSNNLNPAGVMIDGKPDDVKAGPLTWETVCGRQGSMVMIHHLVTSGRVGVTSYYNDEKNAKVPQVSGDAHAYASSGPWITGPIGNTDPRGRGAAHLTGTKTYFYGLAKPTADTARRLLAEEITPLTVTTKPVR